MRGHRRAARLALTVLLATGLVGVAPGATLAKPDLFPTVMDLPRGWMPEGIAIGHGATAWLGSRRDGSVYELDLRTGKGDVISEGPGTPAVGLKHRGRRLFIAGGDSGTARVVDIDSGNTLRTYQLTKSDSTFVNDVVLTRRAAWFTDSSQPRLYKVRIGQRHGHHARKVKTVRLTGEWVQGAGFAANGITRTPDHRALLVVHSSLGLLFRVDPATGEATMVDLAGPDENTTLMSGDGMLLRRRKGKVFVVQNQLNRIALVKLNQAGTTGTLMRYITSEHFDVPTTIARLDSRFYLPNARFGTEPQEKIRYTVVKVSSRR
jgi:streptogramin lyase